MAETTAAFPRETGSDGSWQRQSSAFRDRVTADGASGFPAVAGRYHLYVSLACPWAHRTIIYRRLRGLEDAISMTVVDPERDERGWRIVPEGPGNTDDPVNGFAFLSEAYAATDPSWEGRVTVPVLWDRETDRIVNNESAEIIRMLDREFADVARRPEPLFCPPELEDAIDEVNAFVYAHVNDGVYRCGFAATQEAYDEAFRALFAGLDALEERLATRRYLLGARITEADWRLFTTLARFDPVYVTHFKCNRQRLADYPHLSGYFRDLLHQDGVAGTVDLDHIRRHYYRTHRTLNPSGIIPRGPELDWDAPHGREALGDG
ncbi:MAG TPA: glutathione S-transferase family protein [Miltoncostaeaceae bacterium]|nr:glutathione S-transferase family protein [Miltoncostaeaceae bacterium]